MAPTRSRRHARWMRQAELYYRQGLPLPPPPPSPEEEEEKLNQCRITPNRALRHAILVLSEHINNGLPGLSYDKQGWTLLTILRALGMPPAQIDVVAPWFCLLAERDQVRLNAAWKPFDLSVGNIRKLIEDVTGLTRDELRKLSEMVVKLPESEWKKVPTTRGYKWRKAKTPMWALRQIVPLREDEQRQRETAKTAKRRERRAADKAKLQAKLTQHAHPRETAIIETLMRLSWGSSVADIIRGMNEAERARFPQGHLSCTTLVRRFAERLVQRGKLHSHGLRKSRRYYVRST